MILNHKRIASISQILLAWFGLIVAASAALAVFANNLYQIYLHHLYFSTFLFMLAFVLAMTSRSLSLLGFIFLMPLLPAIDKQLQAFLSIQVQLLPGAGLDLVAGFFLGVLSKQLLYRATTPQSQVLADIAPPWQVGAALLAVTVSTLLAVTRNMWQSATTTSLKGFVFNLIQFRAIGSHDDYQPLIDWVAYGLAGATVAALIVSLKEATNRDQLVFRSLIAGLVASGVLGIAQAFTGVGVTDLTYRVDGLGFAAHGFQPDIHAFGGYLLLGTIGLWGYLSSVRLSSERRFIALTMLLSWLGLLLSKSRIHILLGLCIICFGLLIFVWKYKRRWFFPSFALIGAVFVLLLICLFSFFAWPAELVDGLRTLDLSNFAAVNVALAYRPEMFMLTFGMIFTFPFMGVGQGNFLPMSAYKEFSQLPHLTFPYGENAHNYFLQTVAETGMIGGIAFSIALLAPFFLVRDRRVLLPAAVGLFSLFLSNIYAHSFLIRENLMLASIFLALMYAWVVAKQSSSAQLTTDTIEMPNESFEVGKLVNISSDAHHQNKPNRPWLEFFKRPIVVAIFICGVVLGASREIYQSFYHFPFQYGTLCFVPKPLTVDGWSSGIYELALPAGSHGVTLPLRIIRPHLKRQPLAAQLQIVNIQGVVLADMTSEWKAVGPAVMELRLANNQVVVQDGAKAILKLSSCFTPRNIGMNMDARRLGVLVDPPVIF